MKKIYGLLVVGTMLTACNPEWLDVKRELNLTVPATLDDFRALLNYNLLQNDYLGLAELSADDYVTDEASYQVIGDVERNAYSWKGDTYGGANTVTEWNNAYQQIFQCNVVVHGLGKLTPKHNEKGYYNMLLGEALFHRGRAFFNLAQLFAPPFHPSTAPEMLGIPLRLDPDPNMQTVRASLKDTYNQILEDLRRSSRLLGEESFSGNALLPRKAAAFAALARCYLVMGDYQKSGLYADSALQSQNGLLDFDTMDPQVDYPVSRLNSEIIFQSTLAPLYTVFSRHFGFTPTGLFSIYDKRDLRRSIYFQDVANDEVGFRGSYNGSVQLFSGTTTAEMYLIRAESNLRIGQPEPALSDLNLLRKHRCKPTDFYQLEITATPGLLDTIIAERKRELVRRGLRWMDLRRLNQDPSTAETLARTMNGQVFNLQPNSKRYTFPIPDYIIDATGMEQNER